MTTPADQPIRDASVMERAEHRGAEHWGAELDLRPRPAAPPSFYIAVVAVAVAALVVVGFWLVAPAIAHGLSWLTSPFEAPADIPPAVQVQPAASVTLTPAPLDRTELRIPQTLRAHSGRTENVR